jgi:hypothetical protein
LRVVFLARFTVVVSESPLSIFIVDCWGTLIRLRCDKLTIDLFCQVVSEVPASVGVFVKENRNLSVLLPPCLWPDAATDSHKPSLPAVEPARVSRSHPR